MKRVRINNKVKIYFIMTIHYGVSFGIAVVGGCSGLEA